MIRYLLLIALAQASCSSEPSSKLYGSWRSNAKATNEYIAKHSKLSDYQRMALSKLFGRAVVTFNPDGSGSITMEATTIPKKNGGQFELASSKTDFRFELLGEAESQVVIRTTLGQALFDNYPFAILKLHDQDTYSVSLSDGITEINGREFFERIKKTSSEQGGADQPATAPESQSDGKYKPKPESEERSQ
jgi:hypothetical protein